MKGNQMHLKNKKKTFLTELIFWLHLPIVIFWFGAFLIPLSIWPSRIAFHFWFISGILLIQLAWGIVLYPKIRRIDIICPLTTLLQSLRGYPIESDKNSRHSFIAELLDRLALNISYNAVDILLLITLVIVTLQYFWLGR